MKLHARGRNQGTGSEGERKREHICPHQWGCKYWLRSQLRPMESVCQWGQSILFLLRTSRRRTEGKRQGEWELWEEKNKGRLDSSQRRHELQSQGVINATFHSLIQPPPTHWLGSPMKRETDVYSIIMQSVCCLWNWSSQDKGVMCSLGLWRH